MQEVTARQFMPIHECPSVRCRSNNARGQLQLQTRGSKFVKFQEVGHQHEDSRKVWASHNMCTCIDNYEGSNLTKKDSSCLSFI